MLEVNEITVSELKQKMDNGDTFTLIDVREEHEFDVCNIEGATLIPLGKFHDEIGQLVENNIEVRYVLFPRFGQDSDTYSQMISIWCSEDRNQALDNAFSDVTIATNTKCENPINENLGLAQRLSVAGTPTMFTEDGTVIPGYQPASQIVDFLNNNN